MNDESNLAAVWIRLQSLPKGSDEYDELFWAFERMDELCDSEPATAWNVIQEIIALNHSDSILAMIGAGPFEDLMARHGAMFIDKVESCARTNPEFRRMLGIVWKNQISDDVWVRLKAVAPPSW
jgi:uncharacterized protein DUF6869